jgi:hypothetical protein
MRVIFAVVVVFGLAGCAGGREGTTGSISGSQLGPAPDNYRKIVSDYVRANFKDPYSIRDAQIAAPVPSWGPVLVPGAFTPVWVVCLRANAKNSFGACTGVRDTAVLIHNGQSVSTWVDGNAQLACRSAKYESFPEIST